MLVILNKVCIFVETFKQIEIMEILLKQLDLNFKSIYGENDYSLDLKKTTSKLKELYKNGKVREAEEIVLNLTR